MSEKYLLTGYEIPTLPCMYPTVRHKSGQVPTCAHYTERGPKSNIWWVPKESLRSSSLITILLWCHTWEALSVTETFFSLSLGQCALGGFATSHDYIHCIVSRTGVNRSGTPTTRLELGWADVFLCALISLRGVYRVISLIGQTQ